MGPILYYSGVNISVCHLLMYNIGVHITGDPNYPPLPPLIAPSFPLFQYSVDINCILTL